MASNSTTQTVSQQEREKTTIAVPADLMKAVRIESIESGTDQQDLWAEAMREFLRKRVSARSAA